MDYGKSSLGKQAAFRRSLKNDNMIKNVYTKKR